MIYKGFELLYEQTVYEQWHLNGKGEPKARSKELTDASSGSYGYWAHRKSDGVQFDNHYDIESVKQEIDDYLRGKVEVKIV